MSADISVKEWQRAFERPEAPGDSSALTTTEIAQRLGRSARWVRPRIREALATGRMRRVNKRYFCELRGIYSTVAAFELVAPQETTGRKKK